MNEFNNKLSSNYDDNPFEKINEIKNCLINFYNENQEFINKNMQNSLIIQKEFSKLSIKQIIILIENQFKLFMSDNLNKNSNFYILNKTNYFNQYENTLRLIENKNRKFIKEIFRLKMQNNAYENKICEYMEMEEEYLYLKNKFQNNKNLFLKNDRKDNEILILRKENTNLKSEIKKFENVLKLKEDNIKKINEENEKLKEKIICLKNININHNLIKKKINIQNEISFSNSSKKNIKIYHFNLEKKKNFEFLKNDLFDKKFSIINKYLLIQHKKFNSFGNIKARTILHKNYLNKNKSMLNLQRSNTRILNKQRKELDSNPNTTRKPTNKSTFSYRSMSND